MIFRDNIFVRSFARGLTFSTVYKCFDSKTHKCPMILKFKGREIESIIGNHNHENNHKVNLNKQQK